MKKKVIEIQKTINKVAAESQVYNHSAVLLTSSGDYLKSEGYTHEQPAE